MNIIFWYYGNLDVLYTYIVIHITGIMYNIMIIR